MYYSIDATDSQGYGRMVNDDKESVSNCKMRKVLVGSKPILCLFAKRHIAPGEELRYSYGVPGLPWRKLKVNVFTVSMVYVN
jgi:SET domain-containing protein